MKIFPLFVFNSLHNNYLHTLVKPQITTQSCATQMLFRSKIPFHPILRAKKSWHTYIKKLPNQCWTTTNLKKYNLSYFTRPRGSCFLLAARQSEQVHSALTPQRRLRLLEDGKTAAYYAYVRIFTSRQTPKDPFYTDYKLCISMSLA